MAKKAIGIFFLYIIQEPLKDDFLQFCFFEKIFLQKNVRSGASKKIVFLGGDFKPSLRKNG
jgi:hypothetical protein